MRVAVVGSGYVGLVTGACLADTGNDVVCVDINEAKVARLRQGEVPIYEPGLEAIVRRNLDEGRLGFTTDLGAALRGARICFIAVGTPPGDDGSADLRQVLGVADKIGRLMSGELVVVTKSTVPVGTAGKVREALQAHAAHPFHVCSNPEFLKEGAAIDDFMRPDRIVVGVDSDAAREAMRELYEPFVRNGNPVYFMDIASAEVTKYAANAMLATRISFINQVAEFCERVGADVNQVRTGIGSDRRIGPAFLYPGPGYGGSCFPKDVQALIRSGAEAGVRFDLLEAVEAVNARQKLRLAEKLLASLGGGAGKVVALWGLAFKAETDDMRESPSIPLVEALLAAGVTVRAHDPKARETAHEVFGNRIAYFDDNYEALAGADALAVVTEWRVYRQPDFARMKQLMRRPLIVDGRNLFEGSRLRPLGFEYHGMGRPNA
jgi:UDPglucose 6-dehydrogenase